MEIGKLYKYDSKGSMFIVQCTSIQTSTTFAGTVVYAGTYGVPYIKGYYDESWAIEQFKAIENEVTINLDDI